jgi:pilus assembly protein Flp/PilA
MVARLALTRFARDESGATAVEYALIAGLIFLAIVGAVTNFTDEAAIMFGMIADAIVGA